MSLHLLGDYIEPQELAEELGVALRTVYRWNSLGSGPPPTKIGSRVYYEVGAVKEWMKSRQRQDVR